MANLLGQNIGTNYKGILNLNTLNGNLSGTLESVTDGDGNASPLRLSTSDLAVTQSGNNRLLISTDITMRRNDNTLFFQYSNAPDVLELNGNTIRLNTLRGNTAIGHSVAAARLHVRGDGTNPIGRFEDSTGSNVFMVQNASLRFGASAPFHPLMYPMTGTTFSGTTNGVNLGFYNQNSSAGTTDRFDFGFSGDAVANTAGVVSHLALVRTFAAAAGSANFRPLNIAYTINNSGAQTGTATGIFLNATETALNGMTHNLMDLQRGGVSQFRVDRLGDVRGNSFTGSGYFSIVSEQRINFGIAPNRTILAPIGDGVFRITNGAETDFGRLQFGGITNAFPALKRNGAALEVRLADDSGFADLSAKILNLSSTAFIGGNSNVSGASGAIAGLIAGAGFGSRNASAILQADSTTMGFLPPRGTNAQMLAIATPATGLVFYDTTNNKLNVYDGTNWVAMH